MTEDRDSFLERLREGEPKDPDIGRASDEGAYVRPLPHLPSGPNNASYMVDGTTWDDERPRSSSMDDVRAAGGRLRDRWRAWRTNGQVERTARLLWFALAVIGALAGLFVAYLHVVGDPLADARAYYDAATRLNHGQALYPASADPNAADFYRYPPLLAMVLRPVAAYVSYEWFALAWEVLVVASFVALIWYLGVRSMRTWIAIGILGIPIGWALSIAQAQVPMTLLVALGQPWSIALAANLKLFPALVALYWIGRRDFQATFVFVVWTAIFAVAQLFLEPGGTTAFIQNVGLDEVGQVLNISPYAISPVLWAALVAIGVVLALLTARSRWGWSIAVTLATLAPPRLLVYGLMTLLATVREPESTQVVEPLPRQPRIYTANS